MKTFNVTRCQAVLLECAINKQLEYLDRARRGTHPGSVEERFIQSDIRTLAKWIAELLAIQSSGDAAP